jgi:hypothetical protein
MTKEEKQILLDFISFIDVNVIKTHHGFFVTNKDITELLRKVINEKKAV